MALRTTQARKPVVRFLPGFPAGDQRFSPKLGGLRKALDPQLLIAALVAKGLET